MSRLIPELNLKINFRVSSMCLGDAVGVGCHASTLAGIRMQLDARAPFEWIDPSKGVGKKLMSVAAFGENVLAPELKKPLLALLEANPICAEDHPEFATQIVAACKGIPMWFLSDVINRGSPGRSNVAYGPTVEYGITLPAIRTLQFAQYLIRNKIGYVLETPLIQNPMHRYAADYSINQGWLWIPPEHAKRAIGQAQEHIGSEFPTEDQWIETVGKDVGLKNPAAILRQVFADGRFPEPRFLTPQPKSARAV